MQKNFSAKMWLFSIFSLTSCHLAANETENLAWANRSERSQKDSDKDHKSEEVRNCNTTVSHPPTNCGYNAPALPTSGCNANLYATGSYLYWRASADYLAYGFLDNSFSPDPGSLLNVIFNGKVLEPHFKYKPGYKVGLGYKFHKDRWDFFSEYTRFHQTSHTFKKVTPGGQHIHAIWLTFVNPVLIGEEFKSCSSAWTTNLDIVDAEIGRNFFCGRRLTFRPSLGLRSLWLEQKYDLAYTSIVQELLIKSHNKSTSWGIGPRLALNNSWYLCRGLKILGDLGVSLLHVRDHVTIKQTNPLLEEVGGLSTNVSYANREKITLVKPILDLSIGLVWGFPFYHNKCAFDLQLSYDYSFFWDQASIQLGYAPIVAPGSPIQVIVGGAARSSGNLSIQGLKATARFDF